MEITKRYTIENWKTRNIKIVNIPDKILNLTFENVFKKILTEASSLNVNIIETLFFIIFNHQDWRVLRLPLNSQNPVDFYMKLAIEQSIGINGEALYGKGVPDFLLWKPDEKKYKFVEIKCTEKNLNKNQKIGTKDLAMSFSL